MASPSTTNNPGYEPTVGRRPTEDETRALHMAEREYQNAKPWQVLPNDRPLVIQSRDDAEAATVKPETKPTNQRTPNQKENQKMKIKSCSNCHAETTHETAPVKHPLSEDATIETCIECNFESVVIPHIDTMNIYVKAPPHDLNNGVLIINSPTSITVNDKTVVTNGPLTIRVGNADAVKIRVTGTSLRLHIPVSSSQPKYTGEPNTPRQA